MSPPITLENIRAKFQAVFIDVPNFAIPYYDSDMRGVNKSEFHAQAKKQISQLFESIRSVDSVDEQASLMAQCLSLPFNVNEGQRDFLFLLAYLDMSEVFAWLLTNFKNHLVVANHIKNHLGRLSQGSDPSVLQIVACCMDGVSLAIAFQAMRDYGMGHDEIKAQLEASIERRGFDASLQLDRVYWRKTTLELAIENADGMGLHALLRAMQDCGMSREEIKTHIETKFPNAPLTDGMVAMIVLKAMRRYGVNKAILENTSLCDTARKGDGLAVFMALLANSQDKEVVKRSFPSWCPILHRAVFYEDEKTVATLLRAMHAYQVDMDGQLFEIAHPDGDSVHDDRFGRFEVMKFAVSGNNAANACQILDEYLLLWQREPAFRLDRLLVEVDGVMPQDSWGAYLTWRYLFEGLEVILCDQQGKFEAKEVLDRLPHRFSLCKLGYTDQEFDFLHSFHNLYSRVRDDADIHSLNCNSLLGALILIRFHRKGILVERSMEKAIDYSRELVQPKNAPFMRIAGLRELFACMFEACTLRQWQLIAEAVLHYFKAPGDEYQIQNSLVAYTLAWHSYSFHHQPELIKMLQSLLGFRIRDLLSQEKYDQAIGEIEFFCHNKLARNDVPMRNFLMEQRNIVFGLKERARENAARAPFDRERDKLYAGLLEGYVIGCWTRHQNNNKHLLKFYRLGRSYISEKVMFKLARAGDLIARVHYLYYYNDKHWLGWKDRLFPCGNDSCYSLILKALAFHFKPAQESVTADSMPAKSDQCFGNENKDGELKEYVSGSALLQMAEATYPDQYDQACDDIMLTFPGVQDFLSRQFSCKRRCITNFFKNSEAKNREIPVAVAQSLYECS